MTGLTTFIPAGGRGSRLRPHTFETPKPLLLMGSADRVVIDHPLEVVTDHSEHVWVSTDYLAEGLEAHLAERQNVSTLRDGQTIGSGGSLLEHYEKFSDLRPDGDLLVIPSDHIYDGGLDIGRYLEAHRESEADITLLTVPPKSYGEYVRITDNRAVSIERHANNDTQSTTGTFIFRNDFILNRLRQLRQEDVGELNIYSDIVCPSIGVAAVANYFVGNSQLYWEDTGTHERFLSANMRLSGGHNVVSRSAQIDDDVHMKRCVVLGNAILKGHMQLEDAIVSVSSRGELRVTG